MTSTNRSEKYCNSEQKRYNAAYKIMNEWEPKIDLDELISSEPENKDPEVTKADKAAEKFTKTQWNKRAKESRIAIADKYPSKWRLDNMKK